MSQYSRSSRTERVPKHNSRYNTRDGSPSAGRAWTITSHEEADFLTSPHHSHSPGYCQNRHEPSRDSEPPVRIRSPSPSSRRRNPAENAPTFLVWLQSGSGPYLTHDDAKKIVSTMSSDELLQSERKTALKCSVAEQSRTGYSESVYLSQAPASTYGAHQGPHLPPPQYSGPKTTDRTAKWVDDLRESEASGGGRSRYGGSSRRRGDDEFIHY